MELLLSYNIVQLMAHPSFECWLAGLSFAPKRRQFLTLRELLSFIIVVHYSAQSCHLHIKSCSPSRPA